MKRLSQGNFLLSPPPPPPKTSSHLAAPSGHTGGRGGGAEAEGVCGWGQRHALVWREAEWLRHKTTSAKSCLLGFLYGKCTRALTFENARAWQLLRESYCGGVPCGCCPGEGLCTRSSLLILAEIVA